MRNARHSIRVQTSDLGPRVISDYFFFHRPGAPQNDAFNLAILETLMPQLSGLELAARFRRIRPGFPVPFYTDRANRSWARKIQAAGFRWVVFKPLPMDKLGVAIREALKGEAKGATQRL